MSAGMLFSLCVCYVMGECIVASGAGDAAAGEAPAAKKEEKPKEEEVDALDGGMDMFGGSGGGGDY